MSAWAIYFKERFPLPVYVFLVAGFCTSGGLLAGDQLSLWAFVPAFLGLMTFFAVLRMMDEVKDFEKDKIANPTRPLPRGVLSVLSVRRVILAIVLSMCVFGLVLAVYSVESAILFLAITGWLWLMYCEFYIPTLINKFPLVYALSHQMILLPLSVFPIALADSEAAYKIESWDYGVLVLGAFFCYEVCRKLNPNAHAILKTYRQAYGVKGCLGIVAICCVVSMTAAYRLDLHWFLWPCSLLTLASFLFLKRGSHKIVEGVATLNLAVHIWAVAINHLL